MDTKCGLSPKTVFQKRPLLTHRMLGNFCMLFCHSAGLFQKIPLGIPSMSNRLDPDQACCVCV